MKGIRTGGLPPPKSPAYDSPGKPLAIPLSGLFGVLFGNFESSASFFQSGIFMKGRETAAGAPFGGGGVSFRGCGGEAPTEALMYKEYRER